MKLQIRCATIGAIALLALAGCQGRGHDSGVAAGGKAAQGFTLRIYTVPADRAQAIHDTINRVTGTISASVVAPGKLLVNAPAEMQDSVGDVIDTLSKTAAPQYAPMQVDVHFWVVDGEPGAGDDDPALKGLAGSLASLKTAIEPMHFHLDQAASLVGTSNDPSTLVTTSGPFQRRFSFRVNTIDGNTSRLQLGYEDNGGDGLRKLDTQIDAVFGQYIVLAQAPGTCPQPSTNTTTKTCADKPAMRLLVVRVDRLNPKA